MAKVTKTYSDAGVDYSKVDPIKILAQQAAKNTAKNLNYFDAAESSASRGESAYVWKENDVHRAFVIEGLGSKNLVADAMRGITGKTYYGQIAQDTVAMIVNDLIVVGALPQVINAYFAVGDSNWMSDEERAADLIKGWAAACNLAGAAWGGGETPTLKDIVYPETIDLGGSAVGLIPEERLVLGDKLAAGDSIILVESSGIHANGLTFVRKLAAKLKHGYATELPSGKLFGEAILTPTHIYVPLVKELQKQSTDIHYMVNITGHGWRKLMRATKGFSYTLEFAPEPQEELQFIQKQAGIEDKEMYGNFNMGAGFAVFVPGKEGEKVVAAAKKVGMKAWIAGRVEKGPKQVLIKSKNIVFSGKTLELR
jgi:phosphoribosylformylglycinamidine cyclo-ligase